MIVDLLLNPGTLTILLVLTAAVLIYSRQIRAQRSIIGRQQSLLLSICIVLLVGFAWFTSFVIGDAYEERMGDLSCHISVRLNKRIGELARDAGNRGFGDPEFVIFKTELDRLFYDLKSFYPELKTFSLVHEAKKMPEKDEGDVIIIRERILLEGFQTELIIGRDEVYRLVNRITSVLYLAALTAILLIVFLYPRLHPVLNERD